MLWEDVEPQQTLSDRFGFDSAQAAGDWARAMVAEHWGRSTTATSRVLLSAGNALAWVGDGTQEYVAKWSVVPQRFARLRRAARVCAALHDLGHPVSEPLPTASGRRWIEAHGSHLTLQRVVDGPLLDVSSPAQVQAAGAALAGLHLALARIDEPVPPADPIFGDLAGMVDLWQGMAPDRLPDDALDLLGELTVGLSAPPTPHQWTHGDYRSANILMAGQAVHTVLDFEELTDDHAVVDAAHAAVRLGTRYRGWGPVPTSVHRDFRSGYESVRPFSDLEAQWWDVVRLWQTLGKVPEGPDPTGWRTGLIWLVEELRAGR